jgi:hypothetical protein
MANGTFYFVQMLLNRDFISQFIPIIHTIDALLPGNREYAIPSTPLAAMPMHQLNVQA